MYVQHENKSSRLFPLIQISGILLLFGFFALVYSCSQQETEKVESGAYDTPHDHAFMGDQSCQSCHYEEWEAWKGSHHDYAMAEASEEMVRADFGDTIFEEGEDTYRFFRVGDAFMVEAPGPDGRLQEYEIIYTFGWEPLQQYLVDFDSGKYQALHVAWDTEREEWFSLRPEEDVEPGEWLHWTGGAMNWNTMCADCHSTNLRQNYDADTDSFHTTWSSINVSCEACHGPGENHVTFMQSDAGAEASIDRIREDLNLGKNVSQISEINTCAPCHSLRQGLTGEYVHGDDYLGHFDPLLPHPDNYFADGQILEEVFVYGSFMQSKMVAHDVRCTDCHNPHTLELKATIHDNKLCMQCHEPEYNTPEHHFHEVNTESSQCINCHLTGRYYMEVDYRRDHSFRIPRPDQSAEFGTPNACNDCHSNRSAEWASAAVEEWYGEERIPNHSDIFLRSDVGYENVEEDLVNLISDRSQNEILRATAVWYLHQFGEGERPEVIREALGSDSPIVRSSAAKAAAVFPSGVRRQILSPLLEDTVRAVRIAAMQGLQEFSSGDFTMGSREPFRDALEEYRHYLGLNQYFPQGQMNLAQFLENRGETEQAITSYHRVLEKDPDFNAARINLAHLYNRRGQNERAEELLREVVDREPDFEEAYYSMALLLAEDGRLEESLRWFDEASERMPGRSRIFYNRAIALQTLGRIAEAEASYLEAIRQVPENGDYRYGLITLYMQQEDYERAHEHAVVLNRLQPNNPQIRELLQIIEQRR